MANPTLGGIFYLSSSYQTSGDTFHLEGTFTDDTGAFSSANVQTGDKVALDTSGYAPGTVSSYNILSADATDPSLLILEVQWQDSYAEMIDPSYAAYLAGYVYRATANLSLSADYPALPSNIRAALHNVDFTEKLDLGSGGGSGGATGPAGPMGATGISGPITGMMTWTPGTGYGQGNMVYYRNLLFQATTSHTSSSNFAVDMLFWVSIDPQARVRQKIAHGLAPFTPIYMTGSSFEAARADAPGTLGTHIILEASMNHVLAVYEGDFFSPSHGLTGIGYVSPTESGGLTVTEPDANRFFINPVIVTESPDWFSVVANQPAYTKT